VTARAPAPTRTSRDRDRPVVGRIEHWWQHAHDDHPIFDATDALTRRLWRWRDLTAPLALGVTLWHTTEQALAAAAAGAAVAALNWKQPGRERTRRRLQHHLDRGHRRSVGNLTLIAHRRQPHALTLVVGLDLATDPDQFRRRAASFASTWQPSRWQRRLLRYTPGDWLPYLSPMWRPATAAHIEQRGATWEITLSFADPLERIIPWADLPAPTIDALPVAKGATGWLTLPLRDANWLIAGLPRSGKTTLLHAAIALLHHVPHVQRWDLDPQAGLNFAPWADTAHLTARGPADVLAAIHKLHAEVVDRSHRLYEAGWQKAPHPSHDWPHLVAVIDELATIWHGQTKADRDAGYSALLDVLRLGPKCAVTLIMATQRPAVDVIPGALRDLCDVRVCFRVRNLRASNMVLNDGAAGQGWDASQLHGPGRCIIDEAGRRVHARVPNLTAFALEREAKKLTTPLAPPKASERVIPRTEDVPRPSPNGSQPVSTADLHPATDTHSAAKSSDGSEDPRVILSELLTQVGRTGLRIRDVAPRLRLTHRQVSNHLRKLGATNDGLRWYWPSHAPTRKATG
jgi:hypothetical protein